jgi:anti-anti-sigma factor
MYKIQRQGSKTPLPFYIYSPIRRLWFAQNRKVWRKKSTFWPVLGQPEVKSAEYCADRTVRTKTRSYAMGIQNWSENVILVNLTEEPYLGEDLQAVVRMVSSQSDCSVVADFADASLITSSSLAKLLKLRKTLVENGQKLILCGIKPQTMGIFRLTGLDMVFKFTEDQFLALATLQMATA